MAGEARPWYAVAHEHRLEVAVDRIAAAILLGFVILATTLAWLGRYETAATRGGAFITDRWTGETQVCQSTNNGIMCFHVYPPR